MTSRALAGLIALAALAFAAAAFTALVPLGGVPHVTDEIAYTLQSRLFAAGARTGPPGTDPAALLYPFWQTWPRSYAVFPPGWPALLAAGEAAGLAWIVNPLLAATLPPLTWLLARGLSWHRPEITPSVAWGAAAIAACSPGVWILAGSRMAHTSVLAALLAASVAVVWAPARRLAWWGAGAAIAYVVAARHWDAVLLGGPLIVAGLLRARGPGQRLPLVLLPGLAAGGVLWDNALLTNDPLTFPIGPWFDEWVADRGRPTGCNRLGFGDDVGCRPTLGDWGHTPQKAAAIAWGAAQRMDRLLLGVPGGLALAAVGAWRLRRYPGLLLPIPLVVGGYGLYWSEGFAYGARLWHPLYLLLPLLVACGLVSLADGLGRLAPGARRVARFAAGLWVVGASLIGGSRALESLADRYWCVDPGLQEALARRGVEEGVVFMASKFTRETAWPPLGVEAFRCDAMLEAGDGFLLMDPTRPTGGLQIRHVLADVPATRGYLERHHPGAQGWVVVHDLRDDTLQLVELEVFETPEGRARYTPR